MKVLLSLVPEEIGSLIGKNIPPLALGILKSYLEDNGHTMVLRDFNTLYKNKLAYSAKDQFVNLLMNKEYVIKNLFAAEVDDRLKKYFDIFLSSIEKMDCDMYAISVGSGQSFFEIHFAFLFAKLLKQKFEKPIVFGGINISYLYQFKEVFIQLWDAAMFNFKYFIKGPGEKPLLELFNAYQQGRAIDEVYSGLEGAIYNTDNGLHSNREAIPSFYCPDFDGLNLSEYHSSFFKSNIEDNIKYYYEWPFPLGFKASEFISKSESTDRKDTIFIPYIFNSNCPYRCAFCEQSDEEKSTHYSKKAEHVVNDMVTLSKKYDSKYFILFNNGFNFSKQFVREFCNEVIEREVEIYWSDCARVNGLDEELLQLMYNAGCRKLLFGFETGSPKLLTYINKRLELIELQDVINICKKVGIVVEVEVIVGFPYEYEEDFIQTYNFLKENINTLNYFYPNRYFIIPSSLFGKYPEKYGIEIGNMMSYDDILERSKELIKNKYVHKKGDEGITNFHIMAFNELRENKYTATQNIKYSNEKYLKLQRLKKSFPVIQEANDVYTKWMR